MRYYLGVDWADASHVVWAMTETGDKVLSRSIEHTPSALSEWGRHLDEWQAQGIEVWAAIERPHGMIVDFLLDHGLSVFPVNPKALDRARDRFRPSGSKSDPFDARVLADFLRTDHARLHVLRPSSAEAQELKLLTDDFARLTRQQTRLLNQLTATLKAYYPLALTMWSDLTTQVARAFLQAYPTPDVARRLSSRTWERFARDHRVSAERRQALWEQLQAPQIAMPAAVVRPKSRLAGALVAQLDALVPALAAYQTEIERFFGRMPAAKWARTLPASKSGTTVPTLWARLGDAPGRWSSWHHLQACAGAVPVTQRSGKYTGVHFRFACDKQLRTIIDRFAFLSLRTSEWAQGYYRRQRARGHGHRRALRALAAKWLKILFVLWSRQCPYDETHHLATIARQELRQTTVIA